MKLRLYIWLMKCMYRVVWVGINKTIDDMEAFHNFQDELEDELDVPKYSVEEYQGGCSGCDVCASGSKYINVH